MIEDEKERRKTTPKKPQNESQSCSHLACFESNGWQQRQWQHTHDACSHRIPLYVS
jgi:hypothetical protein